MGVKVMNYCRAQSRQVVWSKMEFSPRRLLAAGPPHRVSPCCWKRALWSISWYTVGANGGKLSQ